VCINPPSLCLPIQIPDANRFVSAEFIFVPNRFLPLIISKSSINRFFRPSRAVSFVIIVQIQLDSFACFFLVLVRECGPRARCVLAARQLLPLVRRNDDRRRVMREQEKRDQCTLASTFFAHVRGK